MNRSVSRTTFGLAIAIGTLGIGATTAGAADTGFTTPRTTPPPPPRDAKLVAAPPEKSTTCEGNAQCGVLHVAYDLERPADSGELIDVGHGDLLFSPEYGDGRGLIAGAG